MAGLLHPPIDDTGVRRRAAELGRRGSAEDGVAIACAALDRTRWWKGPE